jgi:hypothetical protein
MSTSPTARLTLEFDLTADPVGGTVSDDDGARRPFSGWMALTRTIEMSLDAAREAATAASQPDRP